MKFQMLHTEPGVTFGTTVHGKIFYHYTDTDVVKQLVHDRNRMGQMVHEHREIRDPALIKEIKQGMNDYDHTI